MSTKHYDKLGMIFNSFANFQSYLQKSIQTFSKRVDIIEASNLGGTATATGLPEQLILDKKVEELDMYHITDHLHIDVLESRINMGADDLQVGEAIICSPQDIKAHLVATNSERVDFGGFVCLYNILTHIQHRLKVEETFAEVVKHKKYLASLNMSEDEAIKVYTLSTVIPGFFCGKRSTKSDIRAFPD